MKNIKVSSIALRVQFAYLIDGEAPTRATVVKSSPGVYLLRWRDADGTDKGVDLRADDKVTLDYDLSKYPNLPGLMRCSKHGVKIQRPRGEFDCETCFREYGQRARAAAKARKQQEQETGVRVVPETQKQRARRLRTEAAMARVDSLMLRLNGGGFATNLLTTQAAADAAEAEIAS